MAEKSVTTQIGDGTRRCPESKVQKVLDSIEKRKQYDQERNVPQEAVDKIYSLGVVRDEH